MLCSSPAHTLNNTGHVFWTSVLHCSLLPVASADRLLPFAVPCCTKSWPQDLVQSATFEQLLPCFHAAAACELAFVRLGPCYV